MVQFLCFHHVELSSYDVLSSFLNSENMAIKKNRKNSLCHRAFVLLEEEVFVDETKRNQVKFEVFHLLTSATEKNAGKGDRIHGGEEG